MVEWLGSAGTGLVGRPGRAWPGFVALDWSRLTSEKEREGQGGSHPTKPNQTQAMTRSPVGVEQSQSQSQSQRAPALFAVADDCSVPSTRNVDLCVKAIVV